MNQPKKYNFLLPYINWAGIEKNVLSRALFLSKNGYIVVVLKNKFEDKFLTIKCRNTL